MTSEMNSTKLGRRSLLKGAALLSAVAPQLASGQTARPPSGRTGNLTAGAGVATVTIATGKIAGYERRGIFAFKGVPYGATTAGANRFRPAQKPQPWTGVRSCRHFGPITLQDQGAGRLNDEEAFLFRWNDAVQGEDCLRVNVWSPGLDNAKRPVMVWLHGGGFEAGSGHDLTAFEGENLARRGDVVVVTLNHRLNVLGFLDLSAFGDKYAKSGNVGMLDIVTALEWVRDNIASFGGDPDRVTIFGQSGGGAKVTTLMGMPAAKGLFHRGIVQSGSSSLTNTTAETQRLATVFLSELGLDSSSLSRLETLPYADLQRASNAARARASRPGASPTFRPVIDGAVIPASPFNPAAPALSVDVPMIIGTTLNEMTHGLNHPEYEAMTEAEVLAKAEGMFPGKGQRVVAAFRETTPQLKPFDLWSRIATSTARRNAIRQAGAKAALGAAPAYLYWFTWQTPVLDGRPRAFHCAEIPFVFSNTDLCDHMTGGGPRASRLGEVISGAWIQFARTGDPNHSGMPRWTPYSEASGPTMIFDDQSRLAMAPDRKELGVAAA